MTGINGRGIDVLPQFNMYHRAMQVRKEQGLLEEILQREKKIYAQRKALRRKRDNTRERYTRIFEPVTESIGRLKKPPQPAEAEVDDLLDLKDEPTPPKEEELEPEMFEDLEDIEEPGKLYKLALRSVPLDLRDDGVLGLNTKEHLIGTWSFSVAGNKLLLRRGSVEDHIEIDDFDLWCLLLVFNPSKINLKTTDRRGKVLPFVKTYAKIAQILGLADGYESTSKSRKRFKYRLILEGSKQGRGCFMYTTSPPKLVHPDTVVIPSDRAGLKKALFLALSEFRAGNTAMRNVVVPLAAEAQRKGILPENLLSNDEKTWVFA